MKLRNFLLVAAIALVVAASAFASRHPDGLERVAEELGFSRNAEAHLAAPMADYRVPGLSERPGTVVAGLLGAGLTFLLAWGSGRLLARARRP